MHLGSIARCRVSVWLVSTLVATSAAAQQPAQSPAPAPKPAPARAVLVAPSHIDDVYAPLAEGYADFLRQQLTRVGVPVVPGARSRAAMAPARGAASGARFETEIAQARRAGAPLLLLADLRRGRGVVEIDLRLYSLEGRPDQAPPIVGGGLGMGTLLTLAATTNPVLLQLLPAIDPQIPMQPPSEGLPSSDEMAAASRALASLDVGRLADAWSELEGFESLFARGVRSQVDARAKGRDVSLGEQARLLIAQGRVASGWRLVFERAQTALSSDSADTALLLAAGEAQLAQGNARGAVGYFEKGAKQSPDDPRAIMGLGRAYEAAHRLKPAREQYERAAKMSPTRVDALNELAALPSTSPGERAKLLFEAGEHAGGRMQLGEARSQMRRAARMDPALEATSQERIASWQMLEGQHDQAIESYEQAMTAGGKTPARVRGVAQARFAMRDTAAAEASYLEVLQLDHNDVGALTELGELYTETGEPGMAVVRLERARALEPKSTEVQRTLAKALQTRAEPGDVARAIELHEDANRRSEPTAKQLEVLADAFQATGQGDKAISVLETSLRKRQLSPYANQSLSDAYRALGQTKKADELSAIVHLVSGGTGAAPGEGGLGSEEATRFDELLYSFAGPGSAGERVVFLGLETPSGWRDQIVAWMHPKAPNLPAIEKGILQAISRSHQLVAIPVGAMDVLGSSRAALFDFEGDASRSAELISFANLAVEADAIFLGRVMHPLGSAGAMEACGSDPYYVLELRKLGGTSSEAVSLLGNHACVAAGSYDGYATWNPRAIVGLGLLLLVLLRPVIRGWGKVHVTVRTPRNAKALFSVSISRRPKKFKDDKKDSAAPSWRFEKRLETTGGARRLVGSDMVFSIVPARRKYYITVRGPLLDLATEKLVGEFLEEKTVHVMPWRTNLVKFDMRTEKTAITVKPKMHGDEEVQARVALRGNADSVRFTSGGEAYLYADPGEHVVVVGAGDRVVEIPLTVESPAPVSLEVNMDDYDVQLFSGCEAAVAPYVEADYQVAAEALEAAGEQMAAERARALLLQKQGDAEGAARILEQAGMHSESVELRSSDAVATGGPSPDLLEQAGEHRQAGELYEERGDFEAAARNFEAAYEYQRAAECYAELGDTEKQLCMLEAMGDVYEAGKLAASADQTDRAIHNLQQVDSRHGHYSEACRMLAEMLARRGELDVAVTKFGEAMSIWGEGAPLEMQKSYAELLEAADRQQEALSVYEGIRQRDVHFGDVASKIETLRKQVSTVAQHPDASDSAPTVVGTRSQARIGDENSRYEILEELGRGGMGVVFKARDRNLGRVVALKVLPENLQHHPQAVKLFLREARAAAALNHQNIVTLFDAGQEGDAYFLTMECLEGAGLDQVLSSKGTLPTKAVATVGLQVAAGLDYAQRARIVHRDIKPSNLFLTRDRTVKIMDFGLAKMVEEVRRGSTVIGGTPNFMAPEQATGGSVDHRTDLYALGGTLFQLVTGTVPFESGDVVYHHVHSPPPDARERSVDVPAPMAELLLQMMAKDPDDRIQSARDLARALQAILKAS